MAIPLVGTLTIGQAPRPDVTPILEASLPRGTWCVHTGVLDGLSPLEIKDQYGFRTGGRLLVTRAGDNVGVRLDADRVERGVREGLARLEERGCKVIVLLCTSMFQDLECERAWLVEPDQVVAPVLSALIGARRAGVIVPDHQQIESESFKWHGLNQRPTFAAASPYADDLGPLRKAAVEVKAAGAQAIVLDCIGFTERHREIASVAAGLPVFLSNAIVARVAGELVASMSIA